VLRLSKYLAEHHHRNCGRRRGLMALISIFYFMHDTIIIDLGYRHFASIFGLPAAAAASLVVVLVTRAVSGAMSVEFFGLKFQGAASETLMWILCFLAIAHTIEATWKLEYLPPYGQIQKSPPVGSVPVE
jgi:hypothetical protein